MKKTFVVLIGLFLSLSFASAQKVGYVNSETILAQIPEYITAQQQLETLGKQYRSLIEGESAKVDEAYKLYQNDRARLSEDQRKARENQIVAMERAVKEKQNSYFGEEGVMAKKSAALMDPVKKKLDAAVAKVAKQGGYSMILDKSQLKTAVMFSDEQADLSMEVIRNL